VEFVGKNDMINGLMENAAFPTGPTGIFFFECCFEKDR
jgi:hypothetical protein